MTTARLMTAMTACAAVAFAGGALAETILGLTTQNSITVFDSASPRASLDGGTVKGLATNERLIAIDYRASNAQVYLLGDMDNVYTLNTTTFDATLVGTFSPDLTGTSFAFDFNPAFQGGEFARIISDTDDNRVISGNTGQYLAPVAKTDVFYSPADPNFGVNPNIAAIAYTNSFALPSTTQQYGIDATLGVLVTVANNAGTLSTVGSLGVSGLTNELGLDISGATGIAYATLQNSPNSKLYTINLNTGVATEVDTITTGDLIRDITVIPIPEPSTAALALMGGLALLRRRR